MKNDVWKMKDRALSERAEAYGIAWNSSAQGTFSAGRNAVKRAKRAKGRKPAPVIVSRPKHLRNVPTAKSLRVRAAKQRAKMGGYKRPSDQGRAVTEGRTSP